MTTCTVVNVRFTRMLSSRMRTARSLPYGTGLCPRGGLCPGEVSVQGRSLSRGSLSSGVSVQGGLCPGEVSVRGISVQWGLCPGGSLSSGVSVRGISVQWGLCQGEVPVQGGVSVQGDPSPCGQTDACENITLPQSSFAGGKNRFLRSTPYFTTL